MYYFLCRGSLNWQYWLLLNQYNKLILHQKYNRYKISIILYCHSINVITYVIIWARQKVHCSTDNDAFQNVVAYGINTIKYHYQRARLLEKKYTLIVYWLRILLFHSFGPWNNCCQFVKFTHNTEMRCILNENQFDVEHVQELITCFIVDTKCEVEHCLILVK